MEEAHPMYEIARTFRHQEENGYLPDDVYIPSFEDYMDPDHHEVAALVSERYAEVNRNRREERMRVENSILREALEAQGIDPDELLHSK